MHKHCTGDDAARAVAAGAGGGFSGSMHAAAETAFLNSVFTEAGPDSRAAQVGVTAANMRRAPALITETSHVVEPYIVTGPPDEHGRRLCRATGERSPPPPRLLHPPSPRRAAQQELRSLLLQLQRLRQHQKLLQ